MKDYEYYREEMNRSAISVIEGQKGMEENLLLGRIIMWLPKKIKGLFVRKSLTESKTVNKNSE